MRPARRHRMKSLAATRACVLAVALAGGLVGCGPALPPDPGYPAEFLALTQVAAEAQSKYEAGRWDDAAVQFRAMADAADRDPHLAGWRDQAFYNLACVLARAGKPAEAAAAFAESVASGPRAVEVPDGKGGWAVGSPALTIPHLLSDPDLDTIRTEPSYVAALKPYVEAGEPTVVFDHAATEGDVPVVLWLMGPTKIAWPQGKFGTRGAALLRHHGPIALRGPANTPYDTLWLLPDGDARWAVGCVSRMLDEIAAVTRFESPGSHIDGRRYDTGACFVFGVGDGAADAALAAALAEPERVAGFAAVGVKATAPSWSDAVAASSSRRAGKPAWRVVVGPGDAALADALSAAGATVVRASADEAVAAAIRLWLE